MQHTRVKKVQVKRVGTSNIPLDTADYYAVWR
ncbi:hypothetical protein HNQ92_000029 [Rhabdobacter roseus]|uniref:Uncharacterized protein n=1 Tax=Rhabdobacter roseus TaxID=1655419 RepID=A0A840TPF9_9BACT|nr:hypothetical protein [Rhabdobacter roseus]